MAEALPLSWREVLEKYHSTLVDEMGARIDADLRDASSQAAAVARAEGDLRVAETREQSTRFAAEQIELAQQALASAQLQAEQAVREAEHRAEQAIAEARRQAAEAVEDARREVTQAASDSERFTAEAREQAKRATADTLHQSLRRLRQSSGEQIFQVLSESTAPWCPQSMVLVFENNQARAAALRGVLQDGEALTALAFDIAAAPAVVSAIESRDPVISLLSARELSEPLADALGVEPGSRAHLFPIVVRHAVVAVLVVSGAVATPQLELLCDAAAMRLEAAAPEPTVALSAAPAPIPQAALIQIANAETASSPTPGPAPAKTNWEDLSADEQRLHLQAQRMARVRTAEIRLYHSDALQRGTSSSDIYAALKSQIDAARAEFLQNYLSKSTTMVDYLHLEILRTLAHDDDRLLGPSYPGPMV